MLASNIAAYWMTGSAAILQMPHNPSSTPLPSPFAVYRANAQVCALESGFRVLSSIEMKLSLNGRSDMTQETLCSVDVVLRLARLFAAVSNGPLVAALEVATIEIRLCYGGHSATMSRTRHA